ncbi:MAG: T9SS type A sorting domain-containing protein [Chitinophagaceae bacterium]|nr:MAG: T9SS type A sorting domain-containing protein [Chitinophagaceae bacterium]
MKKIVLLIFTLFLFLHSEAQLNRYVIKFSHKGSNPFSISNPSSFLTSRAINRRTKYNLTIDSTDLPITPRFLDSIRNTPNVTVLNKSKWLNLVVIFTTDPAALTKINSFPFVQSVNTIAARVVSENATLHPKFQEETIQATGNLLSSRTENTTINYGQTFGQINFHNGQFLHDRGFQGEGMILAMLDAGYLSYKTNPAFDSIRINNQIIGEWNFVGNAQNTDAYHGHGMNCLSTIAANRPGLMVGTAPHAKFWLFISEDVFSEYPIEEVNWAAAAEYSDSVGADIISSSLGYQDFDNPIFDHLYPDRNGNTSIVTKAADLAAKKGMIVMNSAGNYGGFADQRKYISCPADGDSVVAVGATNVGGGIANFSSWGPNSAGKIKPNVVSVGQGTIIANSIGNPVSGNGTSFSNPNMAGLVTCLWGAFPEYSNMKIIDALQRSAHKFSSPDDRFGYGIPNMRTAYYLLKQDKSRQQFGASGWFRATPNPFTTQIDAAFIADNSGTIKLYLKNISGIALDSVSFISDSLDYKTHSFLNLGGLPAGYYSVQYKSISKDSSITLTKGADLFAKDWIKVFPNPFSNQIYIYLKAPQKGTAMISLFDSKGSLIENKTMIMAQQGNIYYLEFSKTNKLSRAIYTVHYNDGTNKRSIKLLKK